MFRVYYQVFSNALLMSFNDACCSVFSSFLSLPFFFLLDCNNDLTQVVDSIQKLPKGNIIP